MDIWEQSVSSSSSDVSGSVPGHLQASSLRNCHEPEDLLPPGHSLLCFGPQSHGWSGGEGVPVILLWPPCHTSLLLWPRPLIHLSCSDTRFVQTLLFVLALCVLLTSLIITITAYSHIGVTIIGLPSAKERQKAFSTCPSHLIVLSLMYGSWVFIYLKPKQANRLDSNKEAALVNTVVTPLLNPVIYTLQNKQVHLPLWGRPGAEWKYQDLKKKKTVT